MLSSEYFGKTILSHGLFVGYCYDLAYSLIVDIGVSVITVIFLGINSVIKLVRCHQTGLFSSATTFAFMGRPKCDAIVVPLAGASNEGRLWARATLIR